ncbi:MAG: DUF1499 domain-containing protein [Mariprofundus sp.]|nr:DUF1499 domain-containing protein [Mariprofundus sp.]
MATLLILFVLIVIGTFSAGIYSHKAPASGLIDGKLTPCPDKPNCVCSEYETANAQNKILPLSTAGMDDSTAWANLIAAVKVSGGSIQQHSDIYLHAIFTSSLFRFVDDFEARLDTENRKIHIRSASRVGHSDLEVNRKRVEKIRREYDNHSPRRKVQVIQ